MFSYIIECDSTCLECVGGSASECTRCEAGKYLSMDGGSTEISYGSCEDKTLTGGSFILYVSPATTNDYDA